MRIGVVGTGNMGRSLGLLFSEQGHEVFFGSRDIRQAQEAAKLAHGNVQAGSNDEAARFGDVVVWGVRGVSAAEVLQDLSVLNGKTVLDMNNNETRTDGGIGPEDESLAEKLQREIPDAHVVKAFNTLPMEVFEVSKEELQRNSVSVFIASDDEAAKSKVRALATEAGFTAVDLGPLRAARMSEGIADIIRVLIGRGTPPHSAVSLVQLPAPSGQRLGGRQASQLK